MNDHDMTRKTLERLALYMEEAGATDTARYLRLAITDNDTLRAEVESLQQRVMVAERWEPIPYTPGDPQPRISDGVYRGIRIDGRGGFEGIRTHSRNIDNE